MPTTIQCPSGLTGEIRGLTGRDGRYLTDLSINRSNLIPDYILKNCWMETVDPSVYDKWLKPGGEIDWTKILIGDRDYTLIQIRIQSYSKEYPFTVYCQNVNCKASFVWEIDLEQLPTKELSKNDLEVFQNGNKFMTKMPGTEKDITFKLITGGEAHRAAEARKQLKNKSKGKLKADPINLLVESILMKIVAIEGIDEKNPARARIAFRDFLEDAPMGALGKLLDQFDEHDCGVETKIAVECTHCDREMNVDLPFEGDFFFPRKSSKAVGSSKKMNSSDPSEENQETEMSAE